MGWWTLGGLLILTLISHALDLTSGSLGAKKFGATRWGAIGGLVGTIIGMFFFPWGLLLGPMLGVLAGELIGGQELLPAGKSTWGTLLGTTAGIIANAIIGVVMVACRFFSSALWRTGGGSPRGRSACLGAKEDQNRRSENKCSVHSLAVPGQLARLLLRTEHYFQSASARKKSRIAEVMIASNAEPDAGNTTGVGGA